MCGGGGPSAPADTSLQRQQEQFAREDRLRAEEQARIDREKAEARTRFTTGVEAATTGARATGRERIVQRGLDPTEFNPLIESEITRIRGGIPDLAENPSSYFSPDIADLVLGREESARRGRYTNQLNQFFTPSYATSQFADTADDPVLESILGTQYGEALGGVERARARGTLTDAGYNASIRRLGSDRSAASATLQDIGGGVLERNRGQLRNIADEALSGASGYTLGNTFDPTQYTGRAESTATGLRDRLEGDVRGAVGGTQLFDIGNILQFGAREQGAQNPTSTTIAEVLARRASERGRGRGLGSTGTF